MLPLITLMADAHPVGRPKNDPPVVLVPASFDLFHHGHICLLRRASLLGEVVVALGGDDYQETYKRRPVQPYYQRKATLEALGYRVVERTSKSMRQACIDTNPDFIARGSDWKSNRAYLEAGDLDWGFLERNKIGIVILPNEGVCSTTDLIRAAQALPPEGQAPSTSECGCDLGPGDAGHCPHRCNLCNKSPGACQCAA